ncbi:hypothetical protein MTR67_041535 [Solanum verrucosum]|uniref:Uncharacterized protein n=1 Tax=Solanum verrucosum TaxID=315347 RepID=A0AAF0ULS4_SOLVR|nr:hypothetical protein MTR67_041535 [Solanum verrucosum]
MNCLIIKLDTKVKTSTSIYSFQTVFCEGSLGTLVGIADALGDPPFGLFHHFLAFAFSILASWIIRRYSTASRNYSAMRRLLHFTTDLIISFRD